MVLRSEHDVFAVYTMFSGLPNLGRGTHGAQLVVILVRHGPATTVFPCLAAVAVYGAVGVRY